MGPRKTLEDNTQDYKLAEWKDTLAQFLNAFTVTQNSSKTWLSHNTATMADNKTNPGKGQFL